MPLYKGIVSYSNARGEHATSGGMLEAPFYAGTPAGAVERLLLSRPAFVQRRAYAAELMEWDALSSAQYDADRLGLEFRFELGPMLPPIPEFWQGNESVYRNHQWSVSYRGLRSHGLEENVSLPIEQMMDITGKAGEHVYVWPVEYARTVKGLDIDALGDAMERAVERVLPESFDRMAFLRTLYKARKLALELESAPAEVEEDPAPGF